MARRSEAFILKAPYRAIVTDLSHDILSFAVSNFKGGSDVALCTLVEIRGGASKALGAHIAVCANGDYCGYVSGGCVEAAIAFEAMEAISERADRLVSVGLGSPFFDVSLPCGGGITVAVHVLRDVQLLEGVLTNLRRRRGARLHYCRSEQSLSIGEGTGVIGWDGDVFTTSYSPLLRIAVSGSLLEVDAVSRVGQAAGFEIVRLAPVGNERASDVEIDGYTAVVLLHHDVDDDVNYLLQALQRQPFYVGALGSARTHEKRTERLARGAQSPN